MLGSTDPMRCNTAFIRKFCHLGLEREEELQAFLLLVKAGGRIACGKDVVRVADRPSPKSSSSAASASTPDGNSEPVAVTRCGVPSSIWANDTT